MNLPAAQLGGAPHRAPLARADSGRGAPARPPRSWGDWLPTRLLRKGQHLQVFRARLAANDLGPGCYVLKTPRHPADAVAEALLRREVLVARDAVHPHLITVLAAEAGACAYVLSPYLEGVTLRYWLSHAAERSRPPCPVPAALAIARQVAEALSALHQAGWLHGQVRPEHIVASPQGHATLLDLSGCRRLESLECEPRGEVGTAATYAAPEWSLTSGRLACAADTYALGVTLFELLTGKPPFAAHDERQLFAQHRIAAPPDLRQRRPDASLQCAALVRRMLAKEPLRRPSDDELIRWLAEIEIAELAA